MARQITIGKLFAGIAAGLAVAASAYIILWPMIQQSITATSLPGGGSVVESETTRVSWYQVQGPWGVFVLVFFAGLYVLGFYLARKGATTWLVILSLGLLFLSYLAGFSIGLLYLPAALFLLLGALLLYLSRYRGTGG